MTAPSLESPRRHLVAAALLAAGYYVGAHLGFILRLPPSTPSILWPPNAMVTAALLLSPPRRWWTFIAAVFPVHLVVLLEAAFPPALVLALFVTNCSEALIAAAGVRAFSDAPHRLDTLRRMLVFIVMAGLMAPFLSSFLDAGAVTLIRGEPYGQVFQTRLFSNVLSELCIVPAVLTLATGGRRWLREASGRTKLEAVGLGFAILLAAMVVFRGASDTPTPLAFVLPLLMIAAVRFGPAGAGISFLAITLVAIWAGTYRRGPFADLPQTEAVLALQVYLTMLAIPIYAVAGLIEERRRAQRAVHDQLQFQKTLSSLTAAFVHLPETDIDGAIQRWLPRLAASLSLETLRLHETGEAEEGSGSEAVKLVAGGRTLGVLSATRRARAGSRHEELTERLQLVAEVFANALARRHAERALQRSRAELAHYNRVSTMGELAASLAHELRQPLSGILTNAQAALRFLHAEPPPLDEVREAMRDIVEDERRAAAVIQRLRDLLSKREPSRVLLDLNGVIRSVAGMVGSDAVIRRVDVSLQLAPQPILVRGDRIQLEQVILNLMFNGLEAMSDCADRERTLLVRTEREDARAEMTVMDVGAGLPPGAEDRVFEPFFTTKPTGMGMGLSIARSIAESHGGTLRAANNPRHGATFRLVLPLNQS